MFLKKHKILTWLENLSAAERLSLQMQLKVYVCLLCHTTETIQQFSLTASNGCLRHFIISVRLSSNVSLYGLGFEFWSSNPDVHG